MQTIGEALRRSERFTDADRDAAEQVYQLAEAWRDGVYNDVEALHRLRETTKLPRDTSMPPVAIACLLGDSGGPRMQDLMDLLNVSIGVAGKKLTAFGVFGKRELEESDMRVRLHFPDKDPMGHASGKHW